jgi:subtilisin family serine protease
MSRLALACILLILAGFPAPSPAHSDPAPVRVIIGFDPVLAGRDGGLLARLSTADSPLSADADAWSIPYRAVELSPAELDEWAALPGVTSIVPDMRLRLLSSTPTGATGAEALWQQGMTGAGEVIAVLDTGINAGHPVFGGRVVDEACFSSVSSISISLCPNGTSRQYGAGAASPTPCLAAYGAGGLCEHGTHIASIAAGSDATVRGVAPGAGIMALQVFTRFTDSAQPETWVSDVIGALNHVYNQRERWRIAAVNLSFGVGRYTEVCDSTMPGLTSIIGRLRDAGIITVAAAGNGGFDDALAFPACISRVVSVGAVAEGGGRASFSNSQAGRLTLFAPGVNVFAAFSSGYGVLSGTSTATPHTSGAIALLREAAPGADAEQVIAALRTTGAPVGIPGGAVPRIDAGSAYTALAATGAVISAALPGRPAAPHPRQSAPLRVRVVRQGDSRVMLERTFTSDQHGRVALTGLAAGTYSVRVKASNTLARALTVTIAPGNVAGVVMGVLTGGDANDDNNITLVDFTILANTFGAAGVGMAADFNGDGVVTIGDFSILASGFGTSGAP